MYALPLICQAFSLPYAKPVLFICHYQCKIAILHFVLNQRMCPDNHVRIPGFDPCIRLFFLFRRHGTGQQDRLCTQSVLLRHLCQCFKVLYRQHFCRCHQTPLPAVCTAHQKRQKSKDRFTASHVPLNQSVHRHMSCQVCFDLLPNPLLGSGQLIRKRCNQAVRILCRLQRPID